MRGGLKIGDHVSWNSEAGRVSGVIRRKITAPMKFKGYTVRASKQAPQYLIESDKTDHVAVHKGTALRKLRRLARPKPKPRNRKPRKKSTTSRRPSRFF